MNEAVDVSRLDVASNMSDASVVLLVLAGVAMNVAPDAQLVALVLLVCAAVAGVLSLFLAGNRE